MMTRGVWALVVTSLFACSSGGSGGPDAALDAPSDTSGIDSSTPDATDATDASDAEDAGVRTITGAFTASYRQDDGTKTVKPEPRASGTTVSALVLGASGWVSYPGTLASDGTFSVPNVPVGDYMFAVTAGGYTQYVQHASDVLDVRDYIAGRPDLVRVTQSTVVTFNVTNLAPWVTNGFFEISSTQAGVNLRPFTIGGVTQPGAGATSFSAAVDWLTSAAGQLAAGLPDASKSDVVYLDTGPRGTVGTGAAVATLKHVTQYATLTNVTLADGTPTSENVTLGAAAQTGSAALDVRYTKYAALGSDVNPSATPNVFEAAVFSQPYSVAYPDMPLGNASVHLLQLLKDVSAGTATSDGGVAFADFDYGTLTYGQFFDANRKEFSVATFTFDVSYTAQGATSPSVWTAYVQGESAGAFSVPIAPNIGPAKSPLINGQDAFAPHTGVALTPTLSWSAPALGKATSYTIRIVQVENVSSATTLTPIFDATVYGTTTFRIPPNVLVNGASYFADILANAAPWDALDAPYGSGAPLDFAECVSATFTP